MRYYRLFFAITLTCLLNACVSTATSLQPSTQQVPTTRVGAFSSPADISHSKLKEISGITSGTDPKVLFWAVNDSGNAKKLYAINPDGKLQRQFSVNARNRDWESLSQTAVGEQRYLILGDTGDNLRIHNNLTLYFIKEPPLNADSAKPLPIAHSLTFTFPNGKQNVEALAAGDDSIYLITKEPLNNGKAVAGKLYQLDIGSIKESLRNNKLHGKTKQVAQFLGRLQPRKTSASTRLTASLTGVDLSQATALSFSRNNNAAYLLTYKHIVQFDKAPHEDWQSALLGRGRVIHHHGLRQAEAMTIDEAGVIWITSEKLPAPIQAIPTFVGLE